MFPKHVTKLYYITYHR